MTAPSMAEVLAEHMLLIDERWTAELGYTPDDLAHALAAAGFGHVASVERERDAYRKAKQENDERFQVEAQEQCARAEAAEAKVARVQALADEIEALSRSLSPCTGPDCAGCQLGRVASRIRRTLDGEATP